MEDPNASDGSDPGASPAGRSRREFVKTTGIALGAAGLPATVASSDLDSEGGPRSSGRFCGVCANECAPSALPGAPVEADAADGHLPEFGQWDCVTLLVHFADTDPTPASAGEYEEFLFADAPGVGAIDESLSDYWEAVSHGQLSLSPGPEGVAGWYQLEITESEYENADAPYDLLWEAAVSKAKADGFDFSAYDDPLLMTYRSGGDGPAWGGPGGTYAGESFAGSVDCWADAGGVDNHRIGVPAHEIGHALGLPHAYNDGLGDLALMSGGGTWSSPPVHLCAHEKNNIGPDGWIGWDGRSDWTETTDVWLEDGEAFTRPIILPPAHVVDENYRIWDGTRDDGSRYTIEYRPGDGLDRDLDAAGLPVYYFPATSEFDHPLGADVAALDGTTFRTAEADLRHPDAEVEFGLQDVDAAYDCARCNDPEQRSVAPGGESVFAIPIDLDDLPPGTATGPGGETQIDARVAWAGEGDRIDLALVAPDGSEHATSRGTDVAFDVVRSAPIDADNPIEGGWKLREVVADVDDAVDYYRAVSHPAYELATTTVIENAVLEEGVVELVVALSFGDGSDYDPGEFGPPEAAQFDVEIGDRSIDTDAITVVDGGSGTYSLEVDDGEATEGESVSATYTDRKEGVTNDTTTATATLSGLAAKVGVTPDSPTAGETVTFDGSGSTAPNGTITAYEWSFGDGNTGAGETVEHSYDAPGEYEVSLTVVDDDGNSDESTATVPVAEPSLETYANEDGIVDTSGLREAVGHWRDGIVDTDLLTAVLDAWRSGDPVE